MTNEEVMLLPHPHEWVALTNSAEVVVLGVMAFLLERRHSKSLRL